jgi:hypothetical protein
MNVRETMTEFHGMEGFEPLIIQVPPRASR